jgi:hypothetical protein
MRRFACVLASIALIAFGRASASELALYSGVSYTPGTEATYSWALEYRRPLARRWSASFTWLNEGHIAGHHRDGHAAQLWWDALPHRGLGLRLGLGPYHYYDTRFAPNSRGYADAHGWGLLASAEAIWHIDDNWFASLRANRIQIRGAGNSTALVAGIGYSFAPADDAQRSASGPAARRYEVDALVGKAIINSFDSENDMAGALALRVRATRHIGASLTYFNEGDGRQEPRQGLAPQFWLEDDVARRLSVGAGIGPYFLIDRAQRADGTTASRVAGVVSVSAAYALTDALAARLIWNRIVTRDDSDSDVVLLGLGYRF